MPRPLRVTLAVLSFGMFFASAPVLSVLALPVAFVASGFRPRRYRRAVTEVLARLYPWFLYWMGLVGLIRYDRMTLPGEVDRDRPYLLVANHPTLIDVLFCLAWFPRLTSMVKASLYRTPFGLVLRSTEYVRGPEGEDQTVGVPEDDERVPPSVDRMVRQLEAGHPLIAFPEGTRSPPHRLLRFHRGPFEAALRAGVPVVPLFIGVDHPALTKGASMPARRLSFRFDWLPVVDCGGADAPRDSRELRNLVYRRFKERHARYLSDEIGV